MSDGFRLVEPDQLSRDDVQQWIALSERAIEPSPYADPRWFLNSVKVEPTAAVRVALVRRNGELTAALPLAVGTARLSGRLPLRVRSAVTEGELFSQAGVRWYPLVAPGSPVESLESLLRGLRSAGLSLLRVGPFPVDSSLWDAFQTALERLGSASTSEITRVDPWAAATGTAQQVSPGLSTAPDFALAHWSASSQKRLARYGRAIERILDSPLVLTVSDTPESVEEFLQLQSSGWKGDTSSGGVAFLAMGLGDWFHGVAREFRATGSLRVFRLGTPDHAVHMYACVSLGPGVFGLHDAFDEGFRTSHAGTLGRVAVQNAITQGGQFFDPCLDSIYREASRQFSTRRPLAVATVALGRLASRTIAIARGLRLPVWTATADSSATPDEADENHPHPHPPR